MVVSHDLLDGEGEAYAADYVCPDRRMNLHFLELGRSELARLVQDELGHGELAYVVQQRARLKRRHLLARDVQKLPQLGRVQARASHVAVCRLILRVDGNRERLYGLEPEPRDLSLAG